MSKVPFAAKILPPEGSTPDAACRAFDDAATGGNTVLTAPAGYLLTAGPAIALARHRRYPIWLRVGPEDRDPATLLISMVAAAQRRRQSGGEVTLELMRRDPGPVTAWPQLFDQLAGELAAKPNERSALVHDDVHRLGEACPTLALVGEHLLPALARDTPYVLIGQDDVPSGAVPESGRLTVFAAARAVRSMLGIGAVEGALDRASRVEGLLALLAGSVTDQLLRTGAVDRAVPLYLALRDYRCAALAIASVAETLMDLGQWDMLNCWLAQLPEEVLAGHPQLLHRRADIAATRGDLADARRWFGRAASRFATRDNADGACRSMLGVSAVAADSGDLVTAQARACAARSLADAAGLAGHKMWAAWQQDWLSVAAGDTELALASFGHAASVAEDADDASAVEPIRTVGRLAREAHDLGRRQEFHREAQAALEHAERETLTRPIASATTSSNTAEALLGRRGWSRTPTPLKLAVRRRLGDQDASAPTGAWRRLRRTGRVRRDPTHPDLLHTQTRRIPVHGGRRSSSSEPCSCGG